MKKSFTIILALFVLLGLHSCANKEKNISTEGDQEAMISDLEGELSEKSDDEFLLGEEKNAPEMDESMPIAEEAPSMSDTMGSYTVEKGETLMQVAFKLYGDYRKWKEIKEWNNLAVTDIPEGTTLKYAMPAQKFEWNPKGNPYLIKHRDTLGSISKEKYKTSKRWRELYQNNRPLIRDPNLIFAGFTIYYLPARGMASE